MQQVLTQSQQALLTRERTLLENLRVLLARLDVAEEEQTLLRQTRAQMEELFLLVIAGEFNAGKSAFLNALLGDQLLTEGVTPTTSQIHILRYGEEVRQEVVEKDILHLQLPVPWLQNVRLVDTPGVNAVIQRHQEITEEFVPRSDLVLFVTSADRPFSASEREFLEQIQQWSKKVVFIINKIDLVEEAADRTQIIEFVREHGQRLFGVEPQIFAVSARLAIQAKQARTRGEQEAYKILWRASQYDALEHYVRVTLNNEERMRLKLENPLGVAARLINKYEGVIDQRRRMLRDDFETLDTVEAQIAAYEADMRRDFAYQSSRVENVLYEMVERGDDYFDDVLRLTRIVELVNSEKLRGDFEREVVGDTSRQIERHVNDLIDWMIEKDYRQWRSVMDYLRRRAEQHAERLVGKVESDFELNRKALLASIGQKAQHVAESYNRETESLKVAQEVQRAVFQTAAVQVGAIGLGAALVAVLQGVWLDVTGILGAGAVAALGLYVLPNKRRQVKAELRKQVAELRQQLNSALTRQFETELQENRDRLQEAISPYTRFVRVEREKLEKLEAEFRALRTEVADLRRELGHLSGSAAAAPAEIADLAKDTASTKLTTSDSGQPELGQSDSGQSDSGQPVSNQIMTAGEAYTQRTGENMTAIEGTDTEPTGMGETK